MRAAKEAQAGDYTLYHPRWYRIPMSTWWWMGRWPYLKFILREISSVFVAWFVVLLLLEIRALAGGPQAYAGFQARLQQPWMIALNAVSLLFVGFHTITWFNLTPRAMVVRVQGKRVPDLLIAGPNYVVWGVVSAAIAWFLLRS